MNAHRVFPAKFAYATAMTMGLVLALPALAQQADLQGMQMPPANSSSPPAPASSVQSMHGMDMRGIQMPTHPAKPKKAKPHHEHVAAPASANSAHSMANMPMSPLAKPSSAHPPSSHATHGMAMQDTDISSMQGMQMLKQPNQFVELQRLHFGNMIGVRPEPGGMAQGMQGVPTPAMQGMDMSSMQGGKAPPDARSPDYSDGYRYTDMPGMAMSDHAKEGMLLIDQFEYAHDNHGNNTAFLDAEFWYGRDFNKLWLKAEGEYARGKFEDLRTEALWYHATSPYWGTQLGVREDFGEGPNRTWAAIGVEGLAPYWFETEATFYVGQSGRTAARFQFEYEELITQRLVLQPKFEVNLYGKDDPQRGIGPGLSDAEVGLRLRYEFKREFAPYIGVVWRQRFGRTADLYHMQGEPKGDLQFVAGLHFWF